MYIIRLTPSEKKAWCVIEKVPFGLLRERLRAMEIKVVLDGPNDSDEKPG
jgi:hypothetical protein